VNCGEDAIAEVVGGGEYIVNIFTDHGTLVDLELATMRPWGQQVGLPRGSRSELRVCVYPVTSGAEPSIAIYRWFYVVPQNDGTVLFTADGSGAMPSPAGSGS
jgi:hypothetical protein